MSETKSSKNSRRKPGPKPQITLEKFVRICEAFAHGLPLDIALGSEGIKLKTWESYLHLNPQFKGQWTEARYLFLAESIQKLARTDLKWLLERRFSELFKKPADVEVHQTNVINGLPADFLKRAQEAARAIAMKTEPVPAQPPANG